MLEAEKETGEEGERGGEGGGGASCRERAVTAAVAVVRT